MKAEDLIIGDWLQDPFGNIGQVYRLDPGRVHLRLLQERPQDGEYIVHDIEPIQLTPEVLEKNGFEPIKEGRFTTLKNCYGDILFQLEGIKNEYIRNTLYMFKNIPIFYVHELQHALKLCGINKEIMV